jgi:hypothetical protein
MSNVKISGNNNNRRMTMKSLKAMIIVLMVFATASSVSAVVITAEADGHANGANISNAFTGMTLSTVGTDPNLDGQVYARIPINPAYASTGKLVFGNNLEGMDADGSPYNEIWHETFRFRADFDHLANIVSIDFIGNNSSDYGALEAYNSVGALLASVFTPQLIADQVFSAQINRSSFDIAYIVASGIGGDTLYLDNLSANVPEPATMVLLGLGSLVVIRRRHSK